MNEEDQLTVGRIPFFLLSVTVFFRGSIFILLNGPLLYHAMIGSQFNSLSELLKKGVLDTWKSALSGQTSWPSVFLFLLLSFVIGFATNPLQQILASIAAFLSESPKFLKHKREQLKLFSPFQYANKDYIQVMEWLANNAGVKAQWEWQQFYYHL
jgi:hypothetical protein